MPTEPEARVVPPSHIRQMLSVRIEPAQIRELRQAAAEDGLTVSAWLRRLITWGLAKRRSNPYGVRTTGSGSTFYLDFMSTGHIFPPEETTNDQSP